MSTANSASRLQLVQGLQGVAIALLSLVALLGLAASAQNDSAGVVDAATVESAPSTASGAEVYARSCSVCHGRTGLGLEEARDAFPEDHRRCSRCHRPGNPPVMSLQQVESRQHNLFDVGIAPALKGDDTMAALASREALLAYVTATMPRYRPHSLSEAEYEAVTDFLLSLNDR